MDEGDWIQVSDITQFFYCPRKVYFRRTLGIGVEPRAKMELGKEEHERAGRRQSVYGIEWECVEKLDHDVMVENAEAVW